MGKNNGNVVYAVFLYRLKSISGVLSISIYANLQARSIGLSFNDIGIVLGVLPVVSALVNPLLGKTIFI